MFTTDHLILRAVQQYDVDNMLALWNDQDIQKSITLDWVLPRGPKFKETIMHRAESAFLYVTAVTRSEKTGYDSTYVGQAGLSIQANITKNRDASIGLILAKDQWGKGYGKEIMKCLMDHAFKELGFHRLSLTVIATNARAVKLYRELGFVEEGRTREGVWQDGAWQDAIQMGMLEREWRAKDQTPSIEKI